MLNFDSFSWTTASSKLYLSPTSLPLKIPACKGHSLVCWKISLGGNKCFSLFSFDKQKGKKFGSILSRLLDLAFGNLSNLVQIGSEEKSL